MSTQDYWETRHHELRKTRIVMIDGRVASNTPRTTTAPARACATAATGASPRRPAKTTRRRVRTQAQRNAQAMAGFGAREALPLPAGATAASMCSRAARR